MSSVNQTELVHVRTLGTTSVGLIWNLVDGTIDQQNIHQYQLSCQSQQNLSQRLQGQEEILNHMISLDLSGNTTSTTIHGLLPTWNYNCCVTASTVNSCTQVMTNVHGQSSEIPATLAGFVGVIIGVVLTLMVLAAIAATVMGIVVTVRRRRAVARAKIRPILRTESTVYKRNIQVGESTPATGTNKQTDSPPVARQPHTLPRTNRESQIQQPLESVTNTSGIVRTPVGSQGQLYSVPRGKKFKGNQPLPSEPSPTKPAAPKTFRGNQPLSSEPSSTKPAVPKTFRGNQSLPSDPSSTKPAVPKKLKPMVPLKPPIQDKRLRPLRRAKSQPDSRGFRVDMSPETMEAEHIYDTAEVSNCLTLRAKRIVSTDNVAYTQPLSIIRGSSDENFNQEYEQIY